jgi:hypothetical protein
MGVIIDSDFKFLGDSISGTIPPNSIANVDYKVDPALIIYGAQLLYENATKGDFISLQIIDKDNILGYGNDIVVASWIKKWFINSYENYWKVMSEYAGTIQAGLYLRLVYFNISLEKTVDIKINYFFIVPKG